MKIRQSTVAQRRPELTSSPAVCFAQLADFPVVAGNGSTRPRPCENMISDAGVGRQRWLAPAGARGQAAIACISGLTPKILIIRFIL